jgi:hypothetical protein
VSGHRSASFLFELEMAWPPITAPEKQPDEGLDLQNW